MSGPEDAPEAQSAVVELNQEQFLHAELYNGEEDDWVELHALVKQDSSLGGEITVEQAARYLVDHPAYSTGLTNKIRELERRFDFQKYYVDACPTRSGAGLYLRNGNKRSVAYAMRLVQGKEPFQPVRVRDWQDSYTELDLENLLGLPTSDDPVT